MTTRITEITVARLYNTGNYENMKYEVTVLVEDGAIDAAFDMARSTIEAQHARHQQELEAAEQRRRDEWQAEQERQRQVRQERIQAARQFATDPEF